MKIVNFFACSLTALLVASCGGGGGSAGSASPSGDTTSTASIVEVLASNTFMDSSGGSVDLIAVVKDKNNVGLAGEKVQWSADSGSLAAVSSTTDSTGIAKATLTAGSDRSNRDILVQASAVTGVGATIATGKTSVAVKGTSLSFSGAASALTGVSVDYTLKVQDSAGIGISGAKVDLKSQLGNTLSAASVTTDTSGKAVFKVTAAKVGSDTLTASWQGATYSSQFSVTAVDFIFSEPVIDSSININASQPVTVKFSSNRVGVDGKNVSFSSTRGVFTKATVLTSNGGVATTSLSSSQAGPAIIAATLADGTQISTVINFVANKASTLTLQVNPAAIPPNTNGSTSNSATIEALIRDASGNPVAGKSVNFAFVNDRSSSKLSSSIAITDSSGRAQVQFIPGAASTATDGITISAAVAEDATINAITRATISGAALFINFAFSNTVGNVTGNDTLYERKVSVYVTDSQGAARTGQSVALQIWPTFYKKGSLTYNGTVWTYNLSSPIVCQNEDSNKDGFLDLGEDKQYMDSNGSLKGNADGNGDNQLTPGTVLFVSPSTVKTDDQGLATFYIRYGEQYVPWIDAQLTASASVGGTETRRTQAHSIAGISDDFTAEANPPAGVVSPFGTAAVCSDPK